jgi:hypothetical protein
VEKTKYSVNSHQLATIIAWIKAGEIAVPEIQRPFVWDASKVRDFIDSLYQGYPVGYLIVWQNQDVVLKDGTISSGKKILIDGQQRVIALQAAIMGKSVVSKDYKKARIKISFNPVKEEFDVSDATTLKDPQKIPDISAVFADNFEIFRYVEDYCKRNGIDDIEMIFKRIDSLKQVFTKLIGVIELDRELDIETVTEIFYRINSEGVPLSQADFVMSKIASNEQLDGINLRKCIDYFCHLSVEPTVYESIQTNDAEFAKTKFFQSISWLKNEVDDLFDPSYTDILRVAFTSEFERGRLSDLVSLLSGRNFETKKYEENIQIESFKNLTAGVLNFINEANFKNLVIILKSAGFISPDLINSYNSVDFAYILYLTLRKQGKYSIPEIGSYVKRWFVLSYLTGRYSGPIESTFDEDIKNITRNPIESYLSVVERSELSDAFWSVALPEKLKTSSTNSPYFNVFLAAQVKNQAHGFLSKDVHIGELISIKGDIHHIFPKNYLKKNGLPKTSYNQAGNYVYMESETNIRIGEKPPKVYLANVINQFGSNVPNRISNLDSIEELHLNFEENCIPNEIFEMDIDRYEEFLQKRRILMAKKIREYYFSL